MTDEELQSLYRSPKPDKKLVRKFSNGERLGDHLRTSAFWVYYYYRRVCNGVMLTDDELRELVEYYYFPDTDMAAQSAMGECAKSDLLTVQQCEYMLSILKEHAWARQQILARLVLMGDMSDKLAIVEKLIELNAVWGVLEILPTVSAEELTAIRLRMVDSAVFSRGSRHIVREVIDKMVRDDKKKQQRL
ncbi:MAG: hypothetical protein ABIQ57_10290 [Candidatus Kapaibacterium sp.]